MKSYYSTVVGRRFWIAADDKGRIFLFNSRPVWNEKLQIWLADKTDDCLCYVSQLPAELAGRLTPCQSIAVTMDTEVRYLMDTCKAIAE